MGWGTGNIGGGSGGLNFKVVAYATEEALLAEAPKENTIGVITETPMTGWVVDVNEPTAPVNGVVWISTGTPSTVEFNALKKNGIQVHPIYAKQYVSGAWVDKTAKSYQGGEWVDWWNGELYSPGNEWENITGGWVLLGDGTLHKTDEYMKLTPKVAGAYTAWAKTVNTVDLSKYNTLEFDVYGEGTYTDIYLGVLSTGDTFAAVKKLGGMNNNVSISRGVYTVDVSVLNGKYTPAIKLYNGATDVPVALHVYNIVMS